MTESQTCRRNKSAGHKQDLCHTLKLGTWYWLKSMFFKPCGVHEEHERAPGCLIAAGQNMWQAETMIWHWSSPNSRAKRNQRFRNQHANVGWREQWFTTKAPEEETWRYVLCWWLWLEAHTHTSGVSAGSFYERRRVNNRTQLASNGVLYRIAQRKRPHRNALSTCCSGYTVVITIDKTSAAELKSVPLSHDTAAKFPQTGVTALILLYTWSSFGTLLFWELVQCRTSSSGLTYSCLLPKTSRLL